MKMNKYIVEHIEDGRLEICYTYEDEQFIIDYCARSYLRLIAFYYNSL